MKKSLYSLLLCVLAFSNILAQSVPGQGQTPLDNSPEMKQEIDKQVRLALKNHKQDFFIQAKNKIRTEQNNSLQQIISWEKFLALDKAAKERTAVSYNLDLHELKMALTQTAGPAPINYFNSPLEYDKLLKDTKVIYIGEMHDTQTVPAEIIKILQAVRRLNPSARILLASEFAIWNGQENVSLLKKANEPSQLYFYYPEIFREADRLNIDQLALDDAIGSIYETETHPSLTFVSKMGKYMVCKQVLPHDGDNLHDLWLQYHFLLNISHSGRLERNRQWARYINAVKPFYDIVLVYAGRGHLNETYSNDLQPMVENADYVNILLYPIELTSRRLTDAAVQASVQKDPTPTPAAGASSPYSSLLAAQVYQEWKDQTQPLWVWEENKRLRPKSVGSSHKKGTLSIFLPRTFQN